MKISFFKATLSFIFIVIALGQSTFDLTALDTSDIYSTKSTIIVFDITITDQTNFDLLDKTLIQIAYTSSDRSTQDLQMVIISIGNTKLTAEIG